MKGMKFEFSRVIDDGLFDTGSLLNVHSMRFPEIHSSSTKRNPVNHATSQNVHIVSLVQIYRMSLHLLQLSIQGKE